MYSLVLAELCREDVVDDAVRTLEHQHAGGDWGGVRWGRTRREFGWRVLQCCSTSNVLTATRLFSDGSRTRSPTARITRRTGRDSCHGVHRGSRLLLYFHRCQSSLLSTPRAVLTATVYTPGRCTHQVMQLQLVRRHSVSRSPHPTRWTQTDTAPPPASASPSSSYSIHYSPGSCSQTGQSS